MPLRPMLWALVLALLFHGPLLPTALSGWLRWLFRSVATEQAPDSRQQVVIAVELDMGIADDQAVQGAPAPAPAPAQPESTEARPPPDDDADLEHAFDDDEPDAGAPPDAGLDAAPPDAGVDAGAETQDGGAAEVAEAERADAGTAAPTAGRPVRDPYAEAGGAAAVGAEHPNVRIYFAADVLRRRSGLAERFGELLASIPQWGELLGGTEINPVRDFDHILISGPQMRNPRWIVVTLDYHLPGPAMKRAIDKVVKRSGPKGRWRTVGGLRVAEVGRQAERRVVWLASKRMVVILPAEAEDQIPNTKSPKYKFKKSTDAGIVMYVITPWRAFAGSSFRMPKSIKWMRLKFSLAGASGFTVEVEGQDGSEELARQHLPELRRQVDGLPRLGPFRAFDDPSWERRGDRIVARAQVSDFQLRLVLGVAKKVVVDIVERAAKRQRAARRKAHAVRRGRLIRRSPPPEPSAGTPR